MLKIEDLNNLKNNYNKNSINKIKERILNKVQLNSLMVPEREVQQLFEQKK